MGTTAPAFGSQPFNDRGKCLIGYFHRILIWLPHTTKQRVSQQKLVYVPGGIACSKRHFQECVKDLHVNQKWHNPSGLHLQAF